MSATLIYRDVCDDAAPVASSPAACDGACNLALLFDDGYRPPRFQTCEHNRHLLDGAQRAYDARTSQALVSHDLSDERGQLPVPVELTVTMDRRIVVSALTLTFDTYGAVWADELVIACYHGDTLLSRRAYNPDSAVFAAPIDAVGFDRVTLTVYKLNKPGVRLRLNALLLGAVRTVGADAFLPGGCEIDSAVDPTLLQLPIDSARFGYHDDSRLPHLFLDNRKLSLYWQGQLFGTYWLDEGRVSRGARSSRVELLALDSVGLIDRGVPFAGGVYDKKPAAALAAEIVGGVVPVGLDTALQSSTVSGWLPRGSRRDALAQLCFVLGARVLRLADGSLHLAPLSPDPTLLDADALYERGAAVAVPPVTAVELTAHRFAATEDTDYVVVFNEVLNGERLVVFDVPMQRVFCDDGTIVEQSANHVLIRGTGVIPTRVEALPYIHTTSVVRVQNDSYDPVIGADKLLCVTDRTLVTSDNAQAIAARLLQAAGADLSYESDALLDSATAGDRLIVAGEPAVDGRLTRLTLTLGHKRLRAGLTVTGRKATSATHDSLSDQQHQTLHAKTHSGVRYLQEE